MQIKRFEAENVTRALKAVKAELGPDAVILETRKVGFKGGKGVQVTAAFDPVGQSSPPQPAKSAPLVALPAESPLADPPWARKALTRKERSLEQGQAPISTLDPAQISLALDPIRQEMSDFGLRLKQLADAPKTDDLSQMHHEISNLKQLVSDLVVDQRVGALSDDLRPLYLSLTAKGLPRDSAAELMAQLPNQDANRIVETIAQQVPVAGPLLDTDATPEGPIKVLFAGPTGVGKTTTIAKLAAHFAINEKRKVALITLDTFRIGAIEQLTTYASIIGVPSAVAADKQELHQRLREFRNMDLILIDTAGRSPREAGHVDALAALDLRGIQVQLVLPATHSLDDLSATLKAYQSINLNALVLTKLDESARLGAVLQTAMHAGVPVSYLTNGQRIPEDLQLASGARLATQFFS